MHQRNNIQQPIKKKKDNCYYANSNEYIFSLTVHESLGWALFLGRSSLTRLGEKLLSAYACQKYSMKQNDGIFYENMTKLKNTSISTDKRLSNMVIIQFETNFKPGNDNIIYENSQEIVQEKEYRRYVDDNHPLLIQKLGGHGGMDLSNMRFHSREIHISFNKYRLIIDIRNDTFSIQYKKFIKKKEYFLPPTLTREILYVSNEGPIYKEPHFIISKKAKTIIGVASFLECKNYSIKTLYVKYKDSICLYQRVQPDDFSKSYPFVLECELMNEKKEEDNNRDALCKYFEICWRLDATVSRKINDEGLNHVLAYSSKPIHKANIPKGEEKKNLYFKKFDGIPATLIFFSNHFVIRNSIKSDSFEHSLPQKVCYILKNYRFLVESELYVSKYNNHKYCYNREKNKIVIKKPNPLVIIDIQTTAFNARERILILQLLKKYLSHFLYDYFIFFQGEYCKGILKRYPKKQKHNNVMSLSKGFIYEVKLSPNNKRLIKEIVKARYDKYKANSCKMVDLIWEIQNGNS